MARRNLDEAIGRVRPEMIGWAPSQGMKTIGDLLIEISGAELQVVAVLKGQPEIGDEDVKRLVGDPGSLAAILGFLRSVRTETLEYLDSLTEEDLAAEVDLKGWHESIGLETVPRGEILRSVAQHEAYHTGQLVSYLWASGDDPYQWTRG